MTLSEISERPDESAFTSQATGETCPECDGRLVTVQGETHCDDCGLVVEAQCIDHGPEWVIRREREADARRVGPPLTPARHDRGLSTEISYGGDANGTPLSPTKRRQISRLRKRHEQARCITKSEMNLSIACGEIARLTSKLELPRCVREDASLLYRQAQADDLISGRSIETITSGAVYASCRRQDFVRTLEEIATLARCSQHKVRLGFSLLNVELGLELRPMHPTEYVPRIASACEVSQDLERRASTLATQAREAGLANGRNPAGVAAGCLYYVGREALTGLTQEQLAEAAGVTSVTLRERYRELQDLVE